MKGKGVKLIPYPEKTTFKKPSPIRVRRFSKQLTHKSKDYDFGFSPDETNFEKIVYLNRVGSFEEYVGCLAPRNDKKSKRFRSSKQLFHHRLKARGGSRDFENLGRSMSANMVD